MALEEFYVQKPINLFSCNLRLSRGSFLSIDIDRSDQFTNDASSDTQHIIRLHMPPCFCLSLYLSLPADDMRFRIIYLRWFIERLLVNRYAFLLWNRPRTPQEELMTNCFTCSLFILKLFQKYKVRLRILPKSPHSKYFCYEIDCLSNSLSHKVFENLGIK